MASSPTFDPQAIARDNRESRNIDAAQVVWQILTALGSLKLTVTMFALGIVLLFIGTLAQDEQTMVDVKREYFNSWIATVPLHVFLPTTIFGPHQNGGFIFPMPGGATIGLILLLNLVAAKLTRFSIFAKGAKFWLGLLLVFVGLGVTAFVILNAHAENGLQGEPPFSYDALWRYTVSSVYVIGALLASFAFISPPKTRLMKAVLAIAFLSAVASAIFFAFYRIPDPGLRIIWQLFKSLIAGVIILFGLNLLFGKRGGNVLIHLAVGLLMFSQFVFGDRQYEEKMLLQTGETSNEVFSQSEVELAFVEQLPNGNQKHVAVDEEALKWLAGKPMAMELDEMPFDLRVDKWFTNSKLAAQQGSTPNLASDGIGLRAMAVEQPAVGGAQQDVNKPAAYVSLIDRQSKATIATYLVSQEANDASSLFAKTERDIRDEIEFNGKTYELALRYKRTFKPYQVTLNKTEATRYAGTTQTQDFSSFVTITNPASKETQSGRIWMNNPIRFEGESFYQSEFFGEELTGVPTSGLQVVTNAGWLAPYLACVFAGLGMFAHFGNTFVRFASRFDREVESATKMRAEQSGKSPYENNSAGATVNTAVVLSDAIEKNKSPLRFLIPIVTLLVVGLIISKAAMPPKVQKNAIDWYQIGQIPMQSDGRLMPLDSVARRFVQTMSGKTYTLIPGNPNSEKPNEKEDKVLSATEFFVRLGNQDPQVDDARIFRIDADELVDLLDLDPVESGGTMHPIFGKKLNHRYSFNQIRDGIDKFAAEFDRIRVAITPQSQGGQGVPEDALPFKDRKILEFYNKLNMYLMTSKAFQATKIPMPPANASEDQIAAAGQQFIEMQRQMKSIDESSIAGIVPPMLSKEELANASAEQKEWRALNPAIFDWQKDQILKTGFQAKATESVYKVFESVTSGTSNDVRKAVLAHTRYINTLPVAEGRQPKIAFEAWYNHFNPFMQAIVFYIIAIVLTLFSFIVWRQPLRRMAFWIMVAMFAVHLTAIITRIYISERPPVVNLYSSAVFIGCAAVLAGIAIEKIYPIRLGILVGSAVGVLSLLVAWGLDTSDTMPVLQAVLDTQFWLTTHVQCITLGYAATFFAGFIAIYAIVHRIITQGSTPTKRAYLMEEQKILYKLCYGIVCFGLFFSFIGTVLGGLWADDSWGRFWGWDPKENGALIIVMWNAILLHAKWDNMVAEKGFYLLAIGGNIMTAWSWFGTNQLGIGLHSYGFTESVLFILAIFVASQVLLIIGTAFLCQSRRDEQDRIAAE